MNIIIVRRLLNLLRDIVFAYFYLGNAAKSKENHQLQKLLGFLFLLAPFLMYSAEDGGIFSSAFIRLLFRGLCFFLFLFLTKRIDIWHSFYDALLCDVIITINHNIFLTPLTRPLVLGSAVLHHNFYINQILTQIPVHAVTILCYIVIYKMIPLTEIKWINRSRIAFLSTVAGCSLYLNNSLRFVTDNGTSQILEFSIFSIILQLALLLCIIFLEQLQKSLREQMTYYSRNLSAQALLDNILEQRKNDEKLHQLRHDFKNHMNSIRFLLQAQQSEKALDYVNRMIGDFIDTKLTFHTGNQVLDGILSKKINDAETNGICTTISADFHDLNFLDDLDLCIILGNSLDNAIEACLRIPDESERYIDIRGGSSSGSFLLTISNSYHGTLSYNGKILSTSKSDPLHHGLGLSIIQKTLQQYGGIATIQTDEESHKFSLFLAIPLKNN